MNDRVKRFKKYLFFALLFSVISLLKFKFNNAILIFPIIIVLFVICEIILTIYYKNNIPSEEEQPTSFFYSSSNQISIFDYQFEYTCKGCDCKNCEYVFPSKIEEINYFVCKQCKTTNEILDSDIINQQKENKLIKNNELKSMKDKVPDIPTIALKENEFELICDGCDSKVIVNQVEINQNQFTCIKCNKVNILY